MLDRTFFALHVLEACVASSDIMKDSPQTGGFWVNSAQVLWALFPMFLVSLEMGPYFLLLRSNQDNSNGLKCFGSILHNLDQQLGRRFLMLDLDILLD